MLLPAADMLYYLLTCVSYLLTCFTSCWHANPNAEQRLSEICFKFLKSVGKDNASKACSCRSSKGTQFTCFTSTKVQIFVPNFWQASEEATPPQREFTCFTSTKVVARTSKASKLSLSLPTPPQQRVLVDRTTVLSLLALLTSTKSCCFTSTKVRRNRIDNVSKACSFRSSKGTEFTCFTSTKVQILTPEELRFRLDRPKHAAIDLTRPESLESSPESTSTKVCQQVGIRQSVSGQSH